MLETQIMLRNLINSLQSLGLIPPTTTAGHFKIMLDGPNGQVIVATNAFRWR
jgi:hypothetical protein